MQNIKTKTNKTGPEWANSKQPSQEFLLPVLTIHYRGADLYINATAVIPSTEPTNLKGNDLYDVDGCAIYISR